MKASISGIAQHLGDLRGRNCDDRDLVGIDARFIQDHAEQFDVDLGSADDADAMAFEIVDLLDFRFGVFFRALGRQARRSPTEPRRSCAGWRPSRCPLGISSSARPTARSALPAPSMASAVDRAGGGNQRQPDRTALAGEGLRQRLDQSSDHRCPAGPTAIRSVVGPQQQEGRPAMAAKISSAAASSRNGEPFLRPREGKPALEPSEIAMLPTKLPGDECSRGASLIPGMRRSSIALFVGRLYRTRVRSPQP